MRPTPRCSLQHNLTLHFLTLGMAYLMLTACMHPQLSDSDRITDSPPDLSSPVILDVRVLVLGRHPVAVAQAIDDLRRLGFTVIQRDRIQRILDEQDPHLDNPLAAQAYAMHSARVSGAEAVVLVDVDGPKDALSVIVKGIDVETGAILWSGGIVSTRKTMEEEYTRVVIDLTHRAVMDGLTRPKGGSTAVLLSHP